MITIHNLEVRLDVEGDSDEAVFARLFDKYMRQWSRLAEEAKTRQRLAEAHRSLGDRPSTDGT
ncbi:putative phage tail protein [Paraburkholderia sp. BR14374]|uniref:putative phage tail protein n=1 Tax=Paraburkholderia sp. BR14374 TaxID=3237007 RepID=UPI0034CE2694